uniref:(S)-2-haloacid dehalogenase 1 n=1 Tax=Talaromyces marneffei PM1 TaxID=1077442 RepID=A0A093VDD0_TALMA
MASSNKHVVFDIVGTCVSYDAFYDAIEARIGENLRANNIGSRLFGYAWMEAGEREYTYLSMSGHYFKFFDVFRSIFYRTLWQAAQPRPGIHECFSRLRAAGFTVWALTAGDTARVAGYLARGGVEMPENNFVSCDTIKIGKPAPESYQYILDKFEKEGRAAWFAAAHMWDAAVAKRTGFKGPWVSLWEKETCSDIFREMDVVADDLPSLADGIIAASNKQ